jgi:hypothetical protein
MSLTLVLSIIAFVLAVIVAVMQRLSTPTIMLCLAIALVSLVQILGVGLPIR